MSTKYTSKKNRSTKKPGGYFRLYRYVVRSNAWKALKPQAQSVYVALLDRYRDYGGKTNNGRIALSYREARRFTGLSDHGVRKGFHDLIEKGFIKVTKESSFNMKQTEAREYALTEYPVGDALATKEFASWGLHES